MSTNIFDVLILMGAIQGFITSAILFRLKAKSPSNQLLGFILLLISLACLNIYLSETMGESPPYYLLLIEAIVPMIVIMPIGPLLLFYVKSLTTPAFKISRKERLHFIPLVLDIVPNIVAIIYILGVSVKMVNPETQSAWGHFIDSYNMYVDIPRWVSLSLYVWFSIREIKRIDFEKSNVKSFTWAKQLIYGFTLFQLVWFIHLVFYIHPSTSDFLLDTLGWYPIYIPLMIMVYWLGFNGFIIGRSESLRNYKSALIEPEVVEKTMFHLEKAMQEDSLFLNATLSLNDLVDHTNIQQKTISGVLNKHIGKSFNEYVNEFRVNEVKRKLLDSRYQHLTITGIALDSGFNSQATFQRTFKSLTGQSPKEYKKSVMEIKAQKMPKSRFEQHRST